MRIGMVLYRYEVMSIVTLFGDDQWALIRERYAGRDWPRFWRARWAYDRCVGTYPTRAEADAALAAAGEGEEETW